MYNRYALLMRRLIQLLVIFCTAAFVPSALAKTTERPRLPAKILQANSVYVDCVCPRGLAVAQETALKRLQGWGRFQIAENHRQADLIFLFSGNRTSATILLAMVPIRGMSRLNLRL